MSNKITSMCGALGLMLAMSALTGCVDAESATHGAHAGPLDTANASQTPKGLIEHDAIRVRSDAPRNRQWVLALGEVRVYDTSKGRRLLRRITLPNWSVTGFRGVCLPDLILDRSGAATISSNAQARLLRIDAVHFEITNIEVAFHGQAQRDTGFGALAFAADGSLYARTTPGGLLWRIDIAKANAIMIEIGEQRPIDECTITTQVLRGLDRSTSDD